MMWSLLVLIVASVFVSVFSEENEVALQAPNRVGVVFLIPVFQPIQAEDKLGEVENGIDNDGKVLPLHRLLYVLAPANKDESNIQGETPISDEKGDSINNQERRKRSLGYGGGCNTCGGGGGGGGGHPSGGGGGTAGSWSQSSSSASSGSFGGSGGGYGGKGKYGRK